MATLKQLKANLENSKNAGVKTEAGKEVSRHNSYKHGLTSASLISGFDDINETESFYLETYNGLVDSLSPQNYLEELQIHQMTKALIKLRRFDYWEKNIFSKKINKSIDEEISEFEIRQEKQPNLFSLSPYGVAMPHLALALKYKATIEAQYYRALEYLFRLRAPGQLDLFLNKEV